MHARLAVEAGAAVARLGDLAEVDLDEVALLAPFPAAAAVAARGGVILAPPALVERDGPVLNPELRLVPSVLMLRSTELIDRSYPSCSLSLYLHPPHLERGLLAGQELVPHEGQVPQPRQHHDGAAQTLVSDELACGSLA